MEKRAAIDARIKIKINNKEIKTNENSPARLTKLKTNNKEVKTNENPAPQFVSPTRLATPSRPGGPGGRTQSHRD